MLNKATADQSPIRTSRLFREDHARNPSAPARIRPAKITKRTAVKPAPPRLIAWRLGRWHTAIKSTAKPTRRGTRNWPSTKTAVKIKHNKFTRRRGRSVKAGKVREPSSKRSLPNPVLKTGGCKSATNPQKEGYSLRSGHNPKICRSLWRLDHGNLLNQDICLSASNDDAVNSRRERPDLNRVLGNVKTPIAAP